MKKFFLLITPLLFVDHNDLKKILFLLIVPLINFGQGFQTTLPIIIVDTENNTILDDPRIVANMGIINNVSGLNKLNDKYNDYNGKISIELRGSSSQDLFPKKSYSLETQTLNGENNNVSLLGLPEENDWILYGPYSDKTLLRNSLTYDLSRQMGYYAPRTKYCELFINNEYQGIYILTEKIKRDKNRVDIKKTQKDDLTGGYIIKIDKFTDAPIDAAWCSNFTTFNNDLVCFQYHYPKADDITIDQKLYIENFMNTIYYSIQEMKEKQTHIDLVENINFNSFIDYFIISELSKNVDAYRISTFLYKDSDEKNGALNMGPVWDYNLSFGNVDFCKSSEVSGWILQEETACRASIPMYWNDLIQNDSFRNKLSNRWFELRDNTLSIENIFNNIDSISQHIADPQNNNFETWDVLSEYIWPNYQLGQTYQDEISFLKYWIYHRIQWIDNNVNEMRMIFPDCNSNEKKLVKIVNQLGQVSHHKRNELVFYIYDNGCVERNFITY